MNPGVGWGEEEGGTNGESSVETYILPYVKHITSGNFLYDSGNSPWGSVNLEGWDGVRGRKEVQEGGDIYIPMTDSC